MSVLCLTFNQAYLSVLSEGSWRHCLAILLINKQKDLICMWKKHNDKDELHIVFQEGHDFVLLIGDIKAWGAVPDNIVCLYTHSSPAYNSYLTAQDLKVRL